MICIVWPDSGLAVRTVGDAAEVEHLLGAKSDWYPDKYPHPNGSKELGRFVEALDPSVWSSLEVHDLTVQEVYAALYGLGLPSQRDCGETAVRALFSSKAVKAVGARQVNRENRTIIDFITFEDGTKMFLASSPVGAVVYRIAAPSNYTGGSL